MLHAFGIFLFCNITKERHTFIIQPLLVSLYFFLKVILELAQSIGKFNVPHIAGVMFCFDEAIRIKL